MNSSNEYSREYLQQAIDAEIKSSASEESIRALRIRRNAISPISSLPPEIFTAIFSFLCLPASGTSPLGDKPDHLARLYFTHVCHRWREIVLNQPLLWSHLDFTTVSLTNVTEILARAGSAPLSFELEARVPVDDDQGDDPRFIAFQKGLQDHVSHLCHLDIRARPIYVERTLEELVSPAPTLEYLSLSNEEEEASRTRRPKQVSVPDTLFDGTTPRLSWLRLRNCNISWKSPLLKGLRHLEIRTVTVNARPTLTAWLDALDEIPRLQTLVLHSACPLARSFSFDVERTVTLPSLTRLDISASPQDCGLALAHLVLPSLASLCLTVWKVVKGADVQKLLPYVVRHAHGPQDTRPLQSALIRGDWEHAEILAWPVPVPDIDNPLVLLPPRVALSTGNTHRWFPRTCIEILGAALEALPFDSLATLTVERHAFRGTALLDKQFWLRHSPMWPLLQRVQLAPLGEYEFTKMLLEDNGGRESPLLPSLTVLILVGLSEAYLDITSMLCDALMKRVEQGVPLETLDLRMCAEGSVEVRLLSEIVVDVLGLETPLEQGRLKSRWDDVGCDLFAADVDSGEDTDDDEEDEEEEEED